MSRGPVIVTIWPRGGKRWGLKITSLEGDELVDDTVIGAGELRRRLSAYRSDADRIVDSLFRH